MLPCAEILSLLLFVCSAVAAEDRYQYVEVKPGDTLWVIANKYLKDPAQWNLIVKDNPLLGSDPTVALPGMKLKVRSGILKPALRAAELTYMETDVQFRAKDKEEWVPAKQGMALHAGDSLKTGDFSRARIKFPHGSVLNLESRSLIVVQPPADEGGADLQLMEGKLKALHLELKAKDTTIEPKSRDAVYEIAIEDGRVKVDMYGGKAAILAAGDTVAAKGGQSVAVPDGAAPGLAETFVPKDNLSKLALANRSVERVEGPITTDIGEFEVDLETLPTGAPVSGFRLQASKSKTFETVLLDKMYNFEERVSLKDSLPTGVYWWRIAPVDLLGETGKYGAAKRADLR